VNFAFILDMSGTSSQLIGTAVVSNDLLVDVSEVTYVDSVGEQLLPWLRDLQAKFAAETCYARGVCERLQLNLKGIRRR
jgi:hypothetical protein